MLKENIDFSKLGLNDPLVSTFAVNLSTIIEECSSLGEVISMVRLFKTIAVQRHDYPSANKFREIERGLRQQAAAFEHSWAWMNAQQMADEIKKQVAEVLPQISFRPELGSKPKQSSSDDGPHYSQEAAIAGAPESTQVVGSSLNAADFLRPRSS